MPNAALKPCPAEGCPAKTAGGLCAAHRRAREQRRGTARQRGYNRRWETLSRLFLDRYPVCGMRAEGRPPVMSRCRERGVPTQGVQVDHVVPHRGDERLFWDEANWQTLCASCGARKSQAGL